MQDHDDDNDEDFDHDRDAGADYDDCPTRSPLVRNHHLLLHPLLSLQQRT